MSRQDKIRIVLEGTISRFRNEVQQWSKGADLSESYGLVIMSVSPREVAGLRRRLRDHGPKHLYRAVIGGQPVPEVVTGRQFSNANAELSNSPGRHLHLSALPDELARVEQAKPKRLKSKSG